MILRKIEKINNILHGTWLNSFPVDESRNIQNTEAITLRELGTVLPIL